MLKGKTVLLCVTGSIAAYKIAYLASALKKLDAYSKQIPMEHGNAATAEMFIVEPMYAVGSSFANLFSTHPPIEDRIARLEEMARTGHIG